MHNRPSTLSGKGSGESKTMSIRIGMNVPNADASHCGVGFMVSLIFQLSAPTAAQRWKGEIDNDNHNKYNYCIPYPRR